jgi:hypothetical protein
MAQYGVPGDPDEMRRLARALQKDASQLRDGGRDAKREFKRHNSKGPVVKAWKRDLYPALDNLPRHAERLEDIADRLIRGAHQVEVEVARARRAEQEQRAREEAARRAAEQ